MSDNQDKQDPKENSEQTTTDPKIESKVENASSKVETSDAGRKPSDDEKPESASQTGEEGEHGSKGDSNRKDETVPAHAQHAKEGKSSNSKVIGIVIAVIAVIAAIAVCCFMFMKPAEEEPIQEVQVEESSAAETADESIYPPSPIDWAEWQERNDNVYAWVSVPDTGIELPVLQHPMAENYYLEHDIDGNSTIAGAIYSQKTYNSKDFQDDPVTVLYGHTFETNDTMFTKLHMLEDEVFFDEHPNFYIYTPEYNLTYEIISAYEWDNKLILAKYDVHNLDTQQEYFDIVADPESTNKNVREMDRLIAGEDHIVQLSTCTVPSNSNKRYLVTGVLVNAERVSSDGVTVTEKDTARPADEQQ